MRATTTERRLELGPAWVDSGKVFTTDDGSPLRPSWLGDEFERIYTSVLSERLGSRPPRDGTGRTQTATRTAHLTSTLDIMYRGTVRMGR